MTATSSEEDATAVSIIVGDREPRCQALSEVLVGPSMESFVERFGLVAACEIPIRAGRVAATLLALYPIKD